MKTNSTSTTARVLLITPLLIVSLFLFALTFSNIIVAGSARSTDGKNSPDAIVPTTFNGTFDPHVFPCATPRHHFMVPAGQGRITVQVNAVVQINDITVTLLFGPDPLPVVLTSTDTGVGSEVLTYAPGGPLPPGEYQVQVCQAGNAPMPTAPFDYNGVFAYDDTLLGGTPPPPTGPLTAAPQDPAGKVGYENFEPPGEITPVVVTSSGGLTVEYLGRYAIEPSIGANWNTGKIAYQSDLETLFVTFDDSCSVTPKATWVNRPANVSILVDSDPILFTDRVTNRTFVSSLTLLSPDTAKNAYTDNDGLSWTPTQTGGIASAVDHQTMGGGRFHAPLVPPPPPAYQHAVYYCSQDIAFASCALSVDGGTTYGPAIPMYALTACGGLHGHIKVSPVDGTVYIPNRSCGGIQSVVVSEDNGATWRVSPVKTLTQSAAPSNVGGGDDPSLSIDGAGNVYFAFSNFGTQPGVAVSSDKGLTWTKMYDVGAPYPFQNVCFPAATAGDAGRAAVTFYASVTPNGGSHGNSNNGTFDGVWHMFVAHTFDAGTTWTTTDVTPTMPMQRSGLLRGGGADAWRNLADFYDITTDKDGRVLVGYNNGCAGGNCSQAPVNPDGTSPVKGNAYSCVASIARQSSGRRMLMANDPPPGPTAPGMPFVTQLRKGNTVTLKWNQADTGNSPITSYDILRSTTPGNETFLATVTGTQIGGTYTDISAVDRNATYYYKVVAKNAIGNSCANNEIDAPYVGENCTGLLIHRNDPSHPESTGGGSVGQPPTPQLLIDFISVGEPAGTGNLVFKMKVVDLNTLPANSRWRISWDWYNPTLDTQLYYIGMRTDENSAVTFEYGTLADAGVPAVLVLGETMLGPLSAGSGFTSDGTITMVVPRSAVGNPQPGDLLGAIAGKTITGDTPATRTLQRSTAFIDHTFIKGTADTAFPTATYTIVGNAAPCPSGAIVPIGAASRKTHGGNGDWDIDLPFTGTPGIECRKGQGVNSNDHKIVVTFGNTVQVTGSPQAMVTSGSGQVANVNTNGSVVTIDLTNVTNAQTIAVTLFGVSDGVNFGNVVIPMSVLLGDTNANGAVNSTDISQTKSQSGAAFGAPNFRTDVTVNASINSSDIAIVKAQSGTALP